MSQQLTFNLPARTAQGRDDFFVSSANALAVSRLDAPETWTQSKLALIGPEGAGKTHLSQIWVATHGGALLQAPEIGTLNVTAHSSPLAIEIPETPLDASVEETLFHLHNHMVSKRMPLLLIARTPPSRWEIDLPDLKSRMQATDVVQIDAPDDALLSAMLVKLFADRQVQVDPSLIPWLVVHAERSFAAVNHLVAELDAAALAEKRAITRPLARRVLDKIHQVAR